uniref:RING-type domain-containing protein n=1 Tax=Meloidogyne incognita TaxID=6306 RepID=A0A914L1M6_MELIC
MFGRREVYVGGLRENTTADQLDNVFHKFGRIHRIWISSYSPIFAFVEFGDARQAENAIRELDGTYICGSRARVEMARNRWRGGRGFRSSASYRDRSRSNDGERRSRRKVPEEGRGRGEGGGSRTEDEVGERIVNKEQDRSNENNDRNSEKKINEAVVRKCPRCGVQFVKEKGCNHVTCRCDNVFHKFGRIHRIWISSYSPIFAFVEFGDARQAENAIRELDGTYICGSRARVEMARNRWRGGRGFRSSASYRDRSRSNDGERRRLDNVFSPNKLDNADDEEIGLEDDSYNSPVTPPKEKNRSNDNRKRASDTKTTPQSSKQFISQLFECLVCYDKVKLNNVVFCNIPVSATEDSDPEAHTFCLTCVSGHASAAVGEIPMAKGGIGLRCMATGCDNPILYSEIRMVLSEDVQKKLDERILQESIGMASIDKLERCKNCNFAMQMEVDKKINKVFDCLGCGAKMCRICERNWDDEHFGISCEELDAKYKDKKDKKEREIEKQLNEIIVRKCSRCGIQFIKEKGCNKMTCRCGMTQCYLCREIDIKDTHFCQLVFFEF